MMTDITMRMITPEDVAALSFISKETFYDTFTGTCSPDDMDHFLEKYYNEETLLGELKEEGLEYFFAETEGKAIGYLSFRDENPDFNEIKGSTALELKRFYVIKEFHGRGVAKHMMDFFILHATSQAYDEVFLGVWEFNYRAQKFYSKYGFQMTNHRHDFPIGNTPQTDVYMIKYLKQ